MRLYLVRHGETESNVRGACLGRKDVPLNETGIRQARELGERTACCRIDAIYSSPLKRAADTAAEIARTHSGKRVITNAGLIERDYGIWDDMTFDEIKALDPEKYRMWMEDFIGYAPPEGESSEQVQLRVNKAIDSIIDDNKDGCAAVVTHLGVIRHILSHLLGMDTAGSWHFTAENCKLTIIEITEGKTVLAALNA